MDLQPEQIRSIVEQVTRELDLRTPGVEAVVAGADRAVEHAEGLRRAALDGLAPLPDPEKRANEGARSPRGVHANLDQAVRAAEAGHRALVQWPLSLRDRAIGHIRAKLRANVRLLAELAVSETGMGRVDDKMKKNRLVIDKTPGIEDLRAEVITGDHGLTLTECAPYGVIGAAGPSTNPSETVINNGIGMIAGGNAVVFAAHPSAKRVSQLAVSLINEAMVEAGGPDDVITTVTEPTIESAQAMMAHPKTRILVVTGGPGVVQAAMASKKKVIAGGPGNPPVVVDETADLARAGADIVAGASLDNNVICTDEKEVFVVAAAADALLRAMAASGAHVLEVWRLPQLEKLLLAENKGPRRHSVSHRKWIGKDASLILKELGIDAPAARLIVVETPPDHPFVWTELLMPVLPVARVKSADEGMDWAVLAEHGFRHTASIHSRNVDRLSKMARMMDCSIFVKNGPHFAGLGMGGEGMTSFTIASPTGEGMTTARTFTRRRRCALVDLFRIV
ncbi:MAG: aldehyde dehydrogenase family protein [Candidatus Eisenbacteria bacterium]